MTTMNTDVLQSLGLKGSTAAAATTQDRNSLNQSEFLKLMTAQLATQDPFEPMENGDFLGQMAQFSTVTGIEQLTGSFNMLAQSVNQGQAMQAATLVGKEVMVPATSAQLDAGQGIKGSIGLSAPADAVTIGVYDSSGQLVQTLMPDATGSGMNDFAWDGLTANGTPAPAGTYEFRATATAGGATQPVETFLGGQVQNVTADNVNGGLILAVQGLGMVSFGQVARIG